VRGPILAPAQLRAARAFLDWEQDFTAVRIGLSRVQLSDMERGKVRCAGRMAERVIASYREAGLHLIGPNLPEEAMRTRGFGIQSEMPDEALLAQLVDYS
jgi:hypothetical protein